MKNDTDKYLMTNLSHAPFYPIARPISATIFGRQDAESRPEQAVAKFRQASEKGVACA